MINIMIIDTFNLCANNSFLCSKLSTFFRLNNYQITTNIDTADDIIICACGFDKNRQIESKNIINDLISMKKRIIVTGCLPSIDNKFFRENNINIIDFLELSKFDKLYNSTISINEVENNKLFTTFQYTGNDFSSPFYIHISSGCDNRCSYCIIKKAKGEVISKPLNLILQEVKNGISQGYKDFVFLSDDCGSYGTDINLTFADLLNALNEIKADNISYIIFYLYPSKLINLFGLINKNIFTKIKFINIPLQSGSLNILKAMNRNYNPDDVVDIIEKIRKINPSIFIQTHFIYGFTNETREDFYKTLKYIKTFDKSIFFHYTSVRHNHFKDLQYNEIMYRAFILLKLRQNNENIDFGFDIFGKNNNVNHLFKTLKRDYKNQNVDILLIFPKNDENIIIGTPISLLSLCQPLVDGGYNVEIIDQRLEIDFEKKISDIVNNNKLLCVGFTTFTGNSISHIYTTIKYIKDLKNNPPIILGGPHATLFSNELLKNPDIDFILKGESEESFLLFVRHLSSNLPLNNIPGLVYKNNNKIITSDKPAQLTNLNNFSTLPYYLTYNYNKSYSNIMVQTSRGCPFGCKFCAIPILFGSKYRRLDNDKVINVIEDSLLLTNQNSNVVFVDDNFFVNINDNIKLAKTLLNKITNNEIRQFRWWAEIRVNILLKLKKSDLKLFKKTGLENLFLGAESGSDFVLKKIGKGFDSKDIIKANKLLKKLDIEPQYSFIVGFPFETKEDYEKTLNLIDLIKKNNPKAIIWRLNKYLPFPGTPFYYEYNDCTSLHAPLSSNYDFYSTNYDKTDYDLEVK